MPPEERMTIDERRKYLHKMQKRYRQAKSRSERSQLLDEMEQVTELHRKSILRLIGRDLVRKPRQKQRGKTYGREIQAAVQVIARSLDYPCAERLQPNLVWVAEHLEQHQELQISAEARQQLAQMSVSTLRRLLGPVGNEPQRLGQRKGPPSARSGLLSSLPMRRIAWDEAQPGHFEVDLVHHCGASTEGQYVHTLQVIDVATGWSECTPLLGRSFLAMQDGFAAILNRLPIPILELHPDNGGEFLNAFLLKYWKDQIPGLQLSRSRPFHKNDNRFVEENNFSLVRSYVGYQRLDSVAQTRLLAQLYDQLWLYHNFFQPVMRLQEKHYPESHTRPQRRYDAAKPPLDRLIEKKVLKQDTQNRLLALRKATNPCRVRHTLEQLTTRLFNLPAAKEGVTEDVYQTIGLWKTGLFFHP